MSPGKRVSRRLNWPHPLLVPGLRLPLGDNPPLDLLATPVAGMKRHSYVRCSGPAGL
jgi:hypothetical protein